MHAASDSVSDKIADHVEAARLGMLLHRRSDVAEVTAGTHLIDGELQALPRRRHQLVRAWRHFANRHCDRPVADEPVEHRAEVETDDVSLLQLCPIGDAVHDDVVDRRTDHRGIRRKAHRAVAFEGRLRAALRKLLFRHRVELCRRHTWLDHRPHDFENLENHAIGAIHHRDLIAALEDRPFHSVQHYDRDFSICSKTSSTGPTPST